MVEKLGFDLNTWVVDARETIAVLRAEIEELKRRVSELERRPTRHPPDRACALEAESVGNESRGG